MKRAAGQKSPAALFRANLEFRIAPVDNIGTPSDVTSSQQPLVYLLHRVYQNAKPAAAFDF